MSRLNSSALWVFKKYWIMKKKRNTTVVVKFIASKLQLRIWKHIWSENTSMRIHAFVPRNQRWGPQNKVMGRHHQAMSKLGPRHPTPMLRQLLRPLLQVSYSYTALRNSALIATELTKKSCLADLITDSYHYHPFRQMSDILDVCCIFKSSLHRRRCG